MSITPKTHKMLWGRAASRCAFPDCRRELVMDASETDDESLVGEECHIVAKKPSGPRGDDPLPPEQRDKYNNLILLCRVHHKLIDDQVNTYTVEHLQRMKAAHEEWVRESFPKYDAAKQRDDELYAAYVEEWARRVDLDNWRGWSSRILSAQPWMTTAHDKELKDLGAWLLGRIWPKRYPELEAAFKNFRRVLSDFYIIFSKHTIEMWGGEALWTEKFYKLDPPRYHGLLRQWDFHVDLVQDLMLELTRAANYICDHVRQFIYPTFRLHEGLILVETGPTMDITSPFSGITIQVIGPEYQGEERVLYPYPGLHQFKEDREKRDVHQGRGISPEFQVGGGEEKNQ